MKYWIDFAALALLYALAFLPKWNREGRERLLIKTLMYVYLSFVLYFTLMPILPSLPFLFNHPYVPINLVPFIDVLTERGDFLRQIVLNILMTVPFGFLFPLAREKSAKWGETVLSCFLMSLGIELLQPLISNSRSSDVTDLITNVIGGMVGYGLYLALRPVTVRILDRLKAGKGSPHSRFPT